MHVGISGYYTTQYRQLISRPHPAFHCLQIESCAHKESIVQRCFCTFYCVGEFGVVYRANLLRKQGKTEPEFVTVKTMRGVFELEAILHLYL